MGITCCCTSKNKNISFIRVFPWITLQITHSDTIFIKPVLVLTKTGLGGIDRNDTIIGNHSSVRKSMKWTTKVAFHFIEEAVLNSFILFNKVIGKKRFLQFKLLLVRQRLGDVTIEQNFLSLPTVGRHFLELAQPTVKKRCFVCTKEKATKESRYQCKTCSNHPGLCPAPWKYSWEQLKLKCFVFYKIS